MGTRRQRSSNEIDAARPQWATKVLLLLQFKGWSQRELANRMGVHPVRINQWLTGSNSPRLSVLERMAEVLGVRVAELLQN